MDSFSVHFLVSVVLIKDTHVPQTLAESKAMAQMQKWVDTVGRRLINNYISKEKARLLSDLEDWASLSEVRAEMRRALDSKIVRRRRLVAETWSIK